MSGIVQARNFNVARKVKRPDLLTRPVCFYLLKLTVVGLLIQY